MYCKICIVSVLFLLQCSSSTQALLVYELLGKGVILSFLNALPQKIRREKQKVGVVSLFQGEGPVTTSAGCCV